MPRKDPFSRPSRAVLFAAWLATGPVGHLVAFAIDATVAWWTWARGAARARARGTAVAEVVRVLRR